MALVTEVMETASKLELKMKILDIKARLFQTEEIKLFPGVNGVFIGLFAHWAQLGSTQGVMFSFGVKMTNGNLSPRVAGKLEFAMKTVGKIGDYERNEYRTVSQVDEFFSLSDGIIYRKLPSFFLAGSFEKSPLELKITLYKEEPTKLKMSQELEVPKSLKMKETLSAVGRALLEDDRTTDFTVRCGTEVIRVHKNILRAR